MTVQTKPVLYTFYRSMTNQTLAMFRKSGKKSYKNMSDREIVKFMIDNIHLETGNAYLTLDFKTFLEEYWWGKCGNKAIFPESKDMVSRLIEAKYDCNQEVITGALFSLPFESFVLAIPKGMDSYGVPIQSCLVTTGLFKNFCDDAIGGFCKYLDLPNPNFVAPDDMGDDIRQISIIYKDIKTPELAVQSFMTSDRWAEMLACKSPEEYHAKFANEETDLDDSKIQLTLYRLIAGIGIYNTATNGNFLIEGLPGKDNKLKIECGGDQRPKRSFILHQNAGMAKSETSSPGEHHRTWFFRNLRDARYYKGDYSAMEPGSRWVFVPDTIVNAEIEAFTAKQDT